MVTRLFLGESMPVAAIARSSAIVQDDRYEEPVMHRFPDASPSANADKQQGHALAGVITSGVHRLRLRVYYEDTDFSGIVYHANYLRYCERGRSDCLRLLGIDQSRLHREEGGLAFAVRRMEIDFRRPALMDDVLDIETRIIETGGASLTMDQAVKRDGALLVGAQVAVACIRNGRPARIPVALREALAVMCAGGGSNDDAGSPVGTPHQSDSQIT